MKLIILMKHKERIYTPIKSGVHVIIPRLAYKILLNGIRL